MSIASAPTEPDLLFATRKSESAFKQTLAALVREQCPEWQQAEYFLAGPSSMVETLEGTLRELGTEAPRIHVERFSGS